MNNRRALWLFRISIALVIVFPLLFIRKAPYGWMMFDVNTGVIGDTIGGITAPITGLVTIYFLYLAFSQQNELIKSEKNNIDDQKQMFEKERDYDKINTAIKNIRESYSSLQIKYMGGGRNKVEMGFTSMLMYINLGLTTGEEMIETTQLTSYQTVFGLFLIDLKIAIEALGKSSLSTNERTIFIDGMFPYVSMLETFIEHAGDTKVKTYFAQHPNADKVIKDQLNGMISIQSEYNSL